jgi:hypothetical protein
MTAMGIDPIMVPVIEATAGIMEEVIPLAVMAPPITDQAIPTEPALAPGPICLSPDSSVASVASILD